MKHKTKRALIVPNPSRLHQLIQNYRHAQIDADDGWGTLFNTKKHKRYVLHRDIMYYHIVWYVESFTDIQGFWCLESIGSDKMVDVTYKRNQKYMIIEV